MAHRRNQGPSSSSSTRSFSFDRNPISPPPPPPPDNPTTTTTTTSSSTSLAAKAIRASSAHKDSSLSSAYGQAALSSSSSDSHTGSFKDSTTPPNDYTLNEPKPKYGFWGALARKAKAILEDDDDTHTPGPGTGTGTTTLPLDTQTQKYHNLYRTPDSHRKQDSPPPTSHKKGLGAIASSLNSIGGAIGNALEEGLTVVENRTADIIQETRKLQIRKKGSSSQTESKAKAVYTTRQQPSPQMQTDQDIQLKASRDVAMAMAAKAKVLIRELKTVKADLAFAKERCAQLEDENKILRENRQNGSHLEDDELIRLQLETLLAEKARLAQENSLYARENRFLREIVEYHQLTMQDVVYFDQGSEEVTEVYPIKVSSMTNPLSISTTLPPPPPSRPAEALHDISLQGMQHVSPACMPPLELRSNSLKPAEDSKRNSIPYA